MRIKRLSPLQGLQIIPICRQLTLISGLEQASAQLEHISLVMDRSTDRSVHKGPF